jgi:hypothetical protein
VLQATVNAAVEIITPEPPEPTPLPGQQQSRTVPASEVDSVLADVRTFAKEHHDRDITVTWGVKP